MAASNYYEIRCEKCGTSFPPETKRCIHCGGPLGTGLGRLFAPGRAPAGVPAEEEEEEEVPFQRGRNVVWLVTAAIALVLSALRTCTQGP
jgi:hypothetical protein